MFWFWHIRQIRERIIWESFELVETRSYLQTHPIARLGAVTEHGDREKVEAEAEAER